MTGAELASLCSLCVRNGATLSVWRSCRGVGVQMCVPVEACAHCQRAEGVVRSGTPAAARPPGDDLPHGRRHSHLTRAATTCRGPAAAMGCVTCPAWEAAGPWPGTAPGRARGASWQSSGSGRGGVWSARGSTKRVGSLGWLFAGGIPSVQNCPSTLSACCRVVPLLMDPNADMDFALAVMSTLGPSGTVNTWLSLTWSLLHVVWQRA